MNETARVSVDEAAWRAIRQDVAGRRPAEACGALLGVLAPGGARRVIAALPVRNQAGQPGVSYLIEGSRVLELEAQASCSGLVLLGFYHSHPHGAAVPSAEDRRAAWPWYTYLIVAAEAADRPTAWTATAAGGLRRVPLIVATERAA